MPGERGGRTATGTQAHVLTLSDSWYCQSWAAGWQGWPFNLIQESICHCICNKSICYEQLLGSERKKKALPRDFLFSKKSRTWERQREHLHSLETLAVLATHRSCLIIVLSPFSPEHSAASQHWEASTGSNYSYGLMANITGGVILLPSSHALCALEN